MEDVPVVRAAENFESFYRREYRRVLGLAIVLAGNRSVAEELTQEAFLLTLRDWGRVALMENPEAWVRKVVANRSVSWLRRVAVHAKVIVRLGQTPGDQHGLDAEVGLDLWREVRRLPRRQAQTVALIYLDGLSRRDTAAVLDDLVSEPLPAWIPHVGEETAELRIASTGPHMGEEPCFSGTRGSGAIFFSGCACHCFFCQNWQISNPQGKGNVFGCNPTDLVPRRCKPLDSEAAVGCGPDLDQRGTGRGSPAHCS